MADNQRLRLVAGAEFAVSSGDPEDLEIVTIVKVEPTRVLLHSRSDLAGWKSRAMVEAAMAEARGH